MDKLKVYHSFPYPLKVIGASLHGYNLYHWRYGPDTEKLVAEALERETWSVKQWKNWQNERLAYVLHLAATKVPFYRDQWQNRRAVGDTASWEILSNWPVLKKSALIENPKAFLVEDSAAQRFYLEHTSGTTGTPLALFQSRSTLHHWYALYEARIRRWNHASRNDRWAIIGGQMVTPFNQTKPPFWVWNQAFHQLYLSSYHISDVNTRSYISAMEKYQVSYILSYPSSLTALAESVLRKNITVPPLRFAISNAEPLFDYQRAIISKTFQCSVINTYGMSELVCGASECEHGSLHLWPEAGIIEVMDDEQNEIVSQNATGRIIATGLLNSEMPLIRYETGDRGSIKSGTCKCGRKLPIINQIDGRMDDVILTRDGRKIGRLDPIFKANIPIKEAQIIQEDLETVRIKYIPGPGYDHDQLLSQRLHERLGNMNFIFEKVESIPRGSNGKFKAVISKVLN
jgi:phenylacetate-CoA ligase